MPAARPDPPAPPHDGARRPRDGGARLARLGGGDRDELDAAEREDDDEQPRREHLDAGRGPARDRDAPVPRGLPRLRDG